VAGFWFLWVVVVCVRALCVQVWLFGSAASVEGFVEAGVFSVRGIELRW
jgi:hypothetical protein